jgi:hypothetical protein
MNRLGRPRRTSRQVQAQPSTLWCPRCWLAHYPPLTRCNLCEEPVLPWLEACQKYKEIMAQVKDGINKKGKKKC